jgi:hypothetical protein
MRMTAKQFIIGSVFVFLVFAFWVESTRISHSVHNIRPAKDIDVVLIPVSLNQRIPSNHWIRHYDVYESFLPWRDSDSNYLALHFFPHDAVPRPTIRREDSLEFVGAPGGTSKAFCPNQADIDSGRPFVIYLDYIGFDVTSQGIGHAEIRPPQ